MVHLQSHRKTNMRLAPLPHAKEPSTGLLIEFRWSVSAANLALNATKSPSPVLRPIVNTTSRRESSVRSPNSTDRDPFSSISLRTHNRSHRPRQLPKIHDVNRPERSSSISTDQQSNSTTEQQFSPLLLTYSQLQRIQPHLETKGPHLSRLSILAPLSDKQSSVSVATSKVSLSSRPSFSPSSSPRSILSTEDIRFSPENLVRLRTPQLRRLHVSEKYMNEAKQLYFNAASRIFVPRIPIPQIARDNFTVMCVN